MFVHDPNKIIYDSSELQLSFHKHNRPLYYTLSLYEFDVVPPMLNIINQQELVIDNPDTIVFDNDGNYDYSDQDGYVDDFALDKCEYTIFTSGYLWKLYNALNRPVDEIIIKSDDRNFACSRLCVLPRNVICESLLLYGPYYSKNDSVDIRNVKFMKYLFITNTSILKYLIGLSRMTSLKYLHIHIDNESEYCNTIKINNASVQYISIYDIRKINIVFNCPNLRVAIINNTNHYGKYLFNTTKNMHIYYK